MLKMLNRQNLLRLTFVFVILVFAVFGWGLQYKLSLYNAPDSVSHIPQAKLLSNEERAGHVAPVLASDAGSTKETLPPWMASLVLIFPWILLLTGGHGPLSRRISACFIVEPRQRIHQASLCPFFFRPPPR
jgi:hypothetical protein